MADTTALLETIKGMTVLELNDFVKAMQEEFGVSAAPVAAAAAPGAGSAEAAPVAEEKTAFDVVLTAVGPNKIPVIKVVREITGLGLKEAKDLVEGAPQPVKTGANEAEANEIKAKLTAEGATVEVQ